MDIDRLQERLQDMETKAQELVRQAENLQSDKTGLEERVQKLDKELAQERERMMMANIKSQEEKSISLKVETNLKEIQDRLRRDQKERELDSTRARLEAQVKDLEKRLAQEREAWLEALRTQIARKTHEDMTHEERLQSRAREIENRYAQERTRLAGKLEEKNRETEDLKRQSLIETEKLKSDLENKVSEGLLKTKLLENQIDQLNKALQEKSLNEKDIASRERDLRSELALRQRDLEGAREDLKRELANAQARERQTAELEAKLKHVADIATHAKRALNERAELENKINAYRRALRLRDNLIQRVRLALTRLRQERDLLNTENQKTDAWKNQAIELQAKVGDLQREKSQFLLQAKTKLDEKNKEVARLKEDLSVLAPMGEQAAALKKELQNARQELGEVKMKFEKANDRAVLAESLDAAVSQKCEELNCLRVELINAQEQIKAFVSRIAELERRQAAIVSQNQEALNQKDQSLAKLEALIADKNSQLNDLRLTTIEAQEKIENFSARVQELEKSETRMAQKNHDVLARKDQRIEELELRLAEVENENLRFEKAADSVSQERDFLMRAIEVKDKEIVQLRQIADKAARIPDTTEALSKEVGTLKENLLRAEEHIARMSAVSAENQKFEALLQEKNKELDDWRWQEEKNQAELKALREKTLDLARLETLLVAKNRALEELEIVQHDLKKAFAEKEVDVQALNRELMQLRNWLEASREHEASLKQTLTQAESLQHKNTEELFKARGELLVAQREVEALRETKNQSHQRLQDYEAQIRQLKLAEESLAAKQKDLVSEIEKLKSEKSAGSSAPKAKSADNILGDIF